MTSSSSSSSSPLSSAQLDLLARLRTNLERGLTSDEVTARREETESFNVVKPPLDCPPAVCCLLPCIKHVPSMKAFAAIKPDDAEVLRNGEWIRYDATSLVPGDIIRLEEGDGVPADCVVLTLPPHVPEVLVDVRPVTAEDNPRSAKRRANNNNTTTTTTSAGVVQPVQLFWGGTVVQGGCTAVVTETGPQTLVATLIRNKQFPPTTNVFDRQDAEGMILTEDMGGIALVAHNKEVV